MGIGVIKIAKSCGNRPGARHMIEKSPTPWRPASQALLIQLLALFITGAFADGGDTLDACIVASVAYWICLASLLLWDRFHVTRLELFFFDGGCWLLY